MASRTALEVSPGVSWLLQVELTNQSAEDLLLVDVLASDSSISFEKEVIENGKRTWVHPNSAPTFLDEEEAFRPTLRLPANGSIVLTFDRFPFFPRHDEEEMTIRFRYAICPTRAYDFGEDERYLVEICSDALTIPVNDEH